MRIVIVTAVAAVTLGCATSQESRWGHPITVSQDEIVEY